jgi:hypothetical protein
VQALVISALDQVTIKIVANFAVDDGQLTHLLVFYGKLSQKQVFLGFSGVPALTKARSPTPGVVCALVLSPPTALGDDRKIVPSVLRLLS